MNEYSHAVDIKGRMILPVRFRTELGEEFVLTRGLDPCLTIYTKNAWEKMTSRLEILSTTKKGTRELKRFLIGGSTEMECDRQGRILIPAHLRDYAGLKKEAVVVGVGDRIEVWSRERLEVRHQETLTNIADIAEELEVPADFSI